MSGNHNVAGVILAGGKSTRMGGVDKSFVQFRGKSLIQHAIDSANSQVSHLLISSNADPMSFSTFGLPVVADLPEYPSGPLAGVYSSMLYLDQQQTDCVWLAVFPVDSPCIPDSLTSTLVETAELKRCPAAVVSLQGVLQPTFSLWKCSLSANLNKQLANNKDSSLKNMLFRSNAAIVEWPVDEIADFVNINSPADLSALEKNTN